MTSPDGTPTIRPVRPEDVPAVVAMVHELAEYERAPEQCHLTTDQLDAALFGPSPALYGHVAVDTSDRPVGFALWFLNFSTWAGVHGIYLEDLYVRPDARGTGAGRMLLATLAAICVERGYQRLEWWMIHWNPAARFYAAIGATPMDEWTPYRLAGPALRELATHATAAPTRSAP
ncbi:MULTISPECIES: GNAT family N-acetyltransferase [unclassified Micromonospora]|uniref:GNAT family N-acetyltransferase n=1 Tax=unclassified Micromonospora TaxID=2617518 RepID=UPI001C217DA9|nr:MULTISPECIES: GNAT family N-acetyltransferase [unclassified Micromonospora]MBU8856867.1 GNAT family N-acetyltransferase [Micromonospora sp. WMMB482]MDM4782485.1 GNAT family N-acetyltransferase [Micromonospora sp. b486]